MKHVIVRYKVKPDQVERNEELVRAVYEELAQVKPSGFRYATYKLDDGVSFVHVATVEQGPAPLPALAAFQRFQEGIEERCEEQPTVSEASEVGSYRSP
jgi:hypothetical protein